MAAFRTDYFPPSNRRRCVKGRSSYTESSDLLHSAAVSQDQNSNGFSQNEDSYIDSVQSDDGEEEDITIDLSAFLNDNPLLAQAAFESSSENNVASTESSSQFRIIDCKVDPSEIPKIEVPDTLVSVDVNGDTSVNNVLNEKNNVTHSIDSHTFIHDNAKENCFSPEKILNNVTNGEPAQCVVTLNGKKPLSPTKKFSKALGLSNPLKKYKSLMKSKDLNKINEKVFGKYPIVKCEKLDIENFVKNNKIKIRNWPLHSGNQKNSSVNKGTSKKKVNLNKTNLKPKFMKKPINFNKYLIASNKSLANQNISNILKDEPHVSKPIIIKTDPWKAGVANVSPCVPSFFRPLTKTSLTTSKNILCDVLKFNDKTVNLNVISSPEKKHDIITNTVATNIGKIFNIPKTYPLIAPKPSAPLPVLHPKTTTKPVIETLTAPVTGNFTVIEPYVDDPSSPQKPKPILTVPVEVMPSPEKHTPVLNTSIISSTERIPDSNNSEKSEKLPKTDKSVFLNGGIKKIFVPSKIKTAITAVKKEPKSDSEENILNEVCSKTPMVLKVKDASSDDNSSVLKAKNIVVDAMQSAFSSTQSKKTPKNNRSLKKSTDVTSGNVSLLGSSAFSSILNESILKGFSDNDFEDVSFFENESFTDTSYEVLSPGESVSVKMDMVKENSVTKSFKKARERKKYKRKKSSDTFPEPGSTLSASESEIESKLEKDEKTVLSHDENTENSKVSEAVNKNLEKPINNSVNTENFTESVNKEIETKHVDSSLLLSNFENRISESQNNVNCNKHMPSKMVEHSGISLPSLNENIVQNITSPVKKQKENDTLLKQETSTRTLRERKCSSMEVKTLNNSTKLNPTEKHSPDKNKIKGSINSKLKIQLKSPKNSKVKLKKKPSKPEDIIQEINTITGGHSVSKRGLHKSKKSDSDKDSKNQDSSNDIQNDSESNSSNVSFSSEVSICHSRQRKTLKVCIKKSKRKNASYSKMPLNSLTDVIDNAKISNSVSESNLSLHSSFREAKDEKMGTLQKEENSAVNSSSIPDCNMENSSEKLDQKDQIPADSPGLMVNSSKTPLLEGNSNDIKSDVNCTLSNNHLVIENQDNAQELTNDFVNHEEDEHTIKGENDFSSVSNIKNSENYLESSESLDEENNSAILEISPLPIENSKDNISSVEEDNKVIEKDSVSCQNLIEENNDEVIETSSLPVDENSKDTVLGSKDSFKNFVNESENCEESTKENNTSVTEILPTLLTENSESTFFPKNESVELLNVSNSFSDRDNNSNDIFTENFQSICDATLNLPANQNDENANKKIDSVKEVVTANPELSTENELDFTPEETVVEEVISTEIDDSHELVSNNPVIDVCVNDEKETASVLTNPVEEPALTFNGNEMIEENIDISDVPNCNLQGNGNEMIEENIDNSDVPSCNLQVNGNKMIEENIDNSDVPSCNLQVNGNDMIEESIDKSNVPNSNLEVSENSIHINNTSPIYDADLKISLSFFDNSSIVENKTIVVEAPDDSSNNLMNDNLGSNCSKSNEKCIDFSENVELLKSEVKDKIPTSDESVNLGDNVGSNLADISCDRNIGNNEINEVDLNGSCSETKSEIESQSSKENSPEENQNLNCQINEPSLNVSDEISETQPDNTDTLKDFIELEENSPDEVQSDALEHKKCPKLKLFKKTDNDSPDWFVDKSSEAENKSSSDSETFDAKSDNPNSMNSIEVPNITESSNLNNKNCMVNDSEKKSDGDTYDAVSLENTNNSCNFNNSSDEKALTETAKISSEDQSGEKSCDSSFEKLSLPADEVASLKTSKYANEDLPSLNYDDSSKNECDKETDQIHSVVIKEEPMDIEENTESNDSSKSVQNSIKTEPIPNKRKRGRPRRSIEYCNITSDFDIGEVIPKKEETTLPVIPQIKEEEMVIPKTEIDTTPKAYSSGSKRKSNPKSSSTPSSGRKKNYDPELVCVPFSMGWMREHVIRGTGKDNNKRQSDIYYFSPEGTKLRSMPDIMTYLSKHPHIKLSAVNFTFAKELIYREPFEIERDAKQPTKRLSTTPTPKKNSKTPCKTLISPADSTIDITSPVESKKKASPLKRKRSSLNQSDLSSEIKDTTSNTSSESKKPRQQSLSECFSDNNNSDKPLRPSRKIVKKVPFDNSYESQSSKRPRSTVATRNSTGSIKIKDDPVERESLVVKIPLKSPSSSVTKDSELQNSELPTEMAKKSKKESPVKKLSKSTTEKPSKSPAKSSVPEKSTKSPAKSVLLEKLSKSPAKSIEPGTPSSSSGSVSTESLLSRTNIKSPLIQKRLKVKFGQRKTELASLHKPCTKYCNFSYARIPTIQCTVCLCIFHPECVPFKPAGLTKYACMPCVTAQLCGSDSDTVEELVFPDNFDIGILYPSISLQIVEDPIFNATFNKFFYPVDQSFVQTIAKNDVRGQRPLAPKTYSTKNSAYYINTNPVNPLNAPAPRQTSTVIYPPPNLNLQNVRYSVPTSMTVQKAPNVNIQNIYTSNLNNSNSGVRQLRPINPGSLPLLQNFSNSFFVQNRPVNTTSHNASINVQNTFQQSATTIKLPVQTLTNPDGSKVQRTFFIRTLPNHQQIGGLISSGGTQNISDHAKNISVLKTMLQSTKEFANKTIKIAKYNDYSTIRIAGNSISNPLAINIKPEPVPSTSKQSPCAIPSESNDNKNNIESISIKSEPIPSTSIQISSAIPSEPNNNNKRKNEDKNDKNGKKSCNQQVQPSSSAANKNMNSFSEQLSASWNMNKFAQIYECLNFIFKFLNVSDLLRASLVCRSWNHLATQKLLWERVTFSGITIKDWVMCCRIIQQRGTKCIDFRGLYNQDSDAAWKMFLENIHRLYDIEELIFEKVPPYVIKKIADSLPQLRKLTCFCLTSIFTEPEIWSTPCEFELASLRCLGRLEALKISSMGGIHLKDSQLSLLPYLPNLTHLVLSGFKFNSCINLECLSQMQQLITLELGDCSDIEPQIYGLLSHLTCLENLCLQNGGDINDKKLCEAILKMDKLRTLELMNFKISCYLPDALKKMNMLHYFSLWPDSRVEAEQVNFNSFSAAISCPCLKRLSWGILTDDDIVPNTLELKDSKQNEIKKMSFKELFLSLKEHNPGAKVEIKCLPRSIWSEFCSTRNFM